VNEKSSTLHAPVRALLPRSIVVSHSQLMSSGAWGKEFMLKSRLNVSVGLLPQTLNIEDGKPILLPLDR